jgi:hypothetical protein
VIGLQPAKFKNSKNTKPVPAQEPVAQQQKKKKANPYLRIIISDIKRVLLITDKTIHPKEPDDAWENWKDQI